MKHIFFISGDFIDLGKEEVLSLFGIKNYETDGRLLIAETGKNRPEGIWKRLALAKRVYKYLFECKVNALNSVMESYEWDDVYKGSFCIRINNLNNNLNPTKKQAKINKKTLTTSGSKRFGSDQLDDFPEKSLAKYIWNSVKNPKVDLENPKTRIELFFCKNKVYCGLMAYENTEDFESRKSHLRPFPSPSSLHPKLARALVNITGIMEKDALIDPFCGTGGFLIEAGLMQIKVIGYDISRNEVNGCIQNLKHFKIKKYKIINKNALKINKKFNFVVTDLPYGLNSNVYLQYKGASIKQKSNKINLKNNRKDAVANLEKFYLKFLMELRKILKKKGVIVFPSYVDYRKILRNSKFRIEKEFSIPVHRSLTRKIVKII